MRAGVARLEEDPPGNRAEYDEGGLHEGDDQERVEHSETLGEADEPVDAKDEDEDQLQPKEPVGEGDLPCRARQLNQLGQQLRVHHHLCTGGGSQRRGKLV